MIETSNGKSCRTCNKSNVCKYQADVSKRVEKVIADIEQLDLPLSVNISCKEWFSKNISTIR